MCSLCSFLYSCIAAFKLAVSLSAVSLLSVCSVSWPRKSCLSVMIYENFQLFSNFSLKTFGSGVFLYYLCKRFQEEIT